MSDAADDLLRAVARLMADGQRVLLVGASFEMLELLADADVRELVIISDDADPDAPAGETAKGAPLRLRPDYKERPRSKDLIVDPAGVAPADEVERLLKKAGVYLTTTPTEALDALPFGGAVQATEAGAVVLAPTEGPSEMIEALMLAGERRPGPTLYVAGKSAVELPAVACLRGDAEAPGIDPAALDAAEAEARDATAALSAAHDELAALRSALADAQGVIVEGTRRAEAAEAQIADRAALEASLAAAHRERDAAQAALATKSTELDELEAEFEGVRAELAERRVEDRRFESLRARFETARAEMSEEVTALRARLREVDGPAEDAEALAEARDRARTEAQRLLARLTDTLARLAPERRLPATPVYGDSEASAAAIDAWLEVVETVVESTAAELGGLRAEQAAFADRMGELVTRVREQHAALAALEAERAEAPAPAAAAIDASDDELRGRVEALEAALDSERGLRAAERAERLRAIDAAQAAEARLDLLRQRVIDERRAAAGAALARAAAEDEVERLRLEMKRRAAQADDLEEMITAHDRMEGLLTEALHVAEARVESAESARRVAESNLSLLRGEFERLQGAGSAG